MSTTIFDLLSQSSPNCWTCFVFSSMSKTICFLRSKLTPPSPASSPLEVLQGKCLSHQEGHKESTHLPKRVEKYKLIDVIVFFERKGEFSSPWSDHSMLGLFFAFLPINLELFNSSDLKRRYLVILFNSLMDM